MRKRMFQWGVCLMLAAAVFFTGCKRDEKKEPEKDRQIIVAKLQPSVTQLYFKGSLAPLRTVPVLSPVDGTVTKLFFTYGASVEENQNIVEIHSQKLAEDYRDAVTKYLQAKDTYETSLKSFAGTRALYEAGIISEEEFRTERSQHDTNVLNFYQARFTLEKVLREADIDPKTVEGLRIADINAVAQILQKHFRHILVKSPGKGVALFPVKSEDDKDGKGRLVVGMEAKQGQLILSIGDLSGFTITLQVSEININRLHSGLKATVTGDAFPGITLHGIVTAVARQSNPEQSEGDGALSTFNIEVQVPGVTKEQRNVIHVGMSATVEIDVENPPHIILPIGAVTPKNGQSVVTIIDPKTGKETKVPVVTGDTTLTGVIILQGINSGDKVVVHD